MSPADTQITRCSNLLTLNGIVLACNICISFINSTKCGSKISRKKFTYIECVIQTFFLVIIPETLQHNNYLYSTYIILGISNIVMI